MKGHSKKLGIYFAHYECMGHTSRVMAVGEVFKKRFPDGNLFFIQAGIKQPKARIDFLGPVHSLPGISMDRQYFRGSARRAGADPEKRGQVCMDIIAQERPDLFITEFFPLGMDECRHELIPSLVKASTQGAAVWSVAGYPLITGMNSEWREKVLKLYKKIIIFSPPAEKEFIANAMPRAEDRKKYLEFFEINASKIIFAGYLLPQQEVVRDDEDENLPRPPVPKGACRVAVIRGSGAIYPKLIAEAIRASDLLGKEFYMTVAAGPSTTVQEWFFFSTLVRKKKIHNVVLLRSIGQYEKLIRDSDVCVSTAGYHSAVMLLKHRKKAVIVPFEGYGPVLFHEQPSRAGMLKERIGAQVLSIQDMTAETLTAAVKEAALGQGPGELPQEWFTGADVFDQQLTGLFEP